jgi:hypothetical protein
MAVVAVLLMNIEKTAVMVISPRMTKDAVDRRA